MVKSRFDRRRPTPAWIAVLILLPTLILLCFATPPLLVSDETSHFERADGISRGDFLPRLGLDANGRPAAGGKTAASYQAFARLVLPPGFLEGFRPSSSARVREAGRLSQSGQSRFEAYSNTAIYPPLLYVPSAIAIAATRLAHLSLLTAFYAGRLTNSLIFAGVLLWLARRSRDGGAYALSCAVVPITAFSAASFSADALLLGATIVFALELAELPAGGTETRSLALGCSALVLGVGKVAYLPLVVVPPSIAWLIDRRTTRRVVVLSFAAAVAAVLWAVWAVEVQGKVLNIRPDVVANPPDQLRWIAHHPRWFLAIVVRTISETWRTLVPGVFGSRLGWNSAPVPPAVWLYAGTMLLAAAVTIPSIHRPIAASALVWVVVAGCSGVVLLLLYLQYNAVAAPLIIGLQGRYFLPLLIIAAPWLPRVPSAPRPLRVAIPISAALVSCAYLILQMPRWWVA